MKLWAVSLRVYLGLAGNVLSKCTRRNDTGRSDDKSHAETRRRGDLHGRIHDWGLDSEVSLSSLIASKVQEQLETARQFLSH